MNKKEFILEFEHILKSRFGIDLNDIDKDIVLDCYKDDWTPEETGEWLGRKFDLNEINTPYGLKI